MGGIKNRATFNEVRHGGLILPQQLIIDAAIYFSQVTSIVIFYRNAKINQRCVASRDWPSKKIKDHKSTVFQDAKLPYQEHNT